MGNVRGRVGWVGGRTKGSDEEYMDSHVLKVLKVGVGTQC